MLVDGSQSTQVRRQDRNPKRRARGLFLHLHCHLHTPSLACVGLPTPQGRQRADPCSLTFPQPSSGFQGTLGIRWGDYCHVGPQDLRGQNQRFTSDFSALALSWHGIMGGSGRRRLDPQYPKSEDEQRKEAAGGTSCADITKNCVPAEEGFFVAASRGLTSTKGILLWFPGLLFVWQVASKEFCNLERSL